MRRKYCGRRAGAASYWLVRKGAVAEVASFGDGAGGASDDVVLGAAPSGVAAAGEKGTVWTEHNLLALLQEQGLSNQTT